MAWKPIETAFKDDESDEVLLFINQGGFGTTVIGMWREDLGIWTTQLEYDELPIFWDDMPEEPEGWEEL